MVRIARCDLPVGKASCDEIRRILEIRGAPYPAHDFIPAQVPIAFKPGSLEGVMTGWAIVNLPDRPYVFAIMTTYDVNAENAPAVRAASQAAYNYFKTQSKRMGSP